MIPPDPQVPKEVYQLTHNYRSHTGILSLASSVLDLLLELFPDSFDRLEPDQGMFEGPKPVLIESCSPSESTSGGLLYRDRSGLGHVWETPDLLFKLTKDILKTYM